MQCWYRFKVLVEAKRFDKKDFDCNNNPIYPTFFCWLVQFFFFSYDRISIFEISCVPIFRQNAQHYFFWTKFAQKWILRLEIQKTNVWKRISIFEILCVPIFRQNGPLWLLGPNLPKNGFWGPSFKNLSRDSESEPLKNYVSKFSVK